MRSIHFTKSCEIFYLLSGPNVQSGYLLDTGLQKLGRYDLWINLDQHVVGNQALLEHIYLQMFIYMLSMDIFVQWQGVE